MALHSSYYALLVLAMTSMLVVRNILTWLCDSFQIWELLGILFFKQLAVNLFGI